MPSKSSVNNRTGPKTSLSGYTLSSKRSSLISWDYSFDSGTHYIDLNISSQPDSLTLRVYRRR